MWVCVCVRVRRCVHTHAKTLGAETGIGSDAGNPRFSSNNLRIQNFLFPFSKPQKNGTNARRVCHLPHDILRHFLCLVSLVRSSDAALLPCSGKIDEKCCPLCDIEEDCWYNNNELINDVCKLVTLLIRFKNGNEQGKSR